MGCNSSTCGMPNRLCKACLMHVTTETNIYIINNTDILLTHILHGVEQHIHIKYKMIGHLRLYISLGDKTTYDYLIRKMLSNFSRVIDSYRNRHKVDIYMVHKSNTRVEIVECYKDGILETYNACRNFMIPIGYSFGANLIKDVFLLRVGMFPNLQFTLTRAFFSFSDGKTTINIRPSGNGNGLYIDYTGSYPSNDLEKIMKNILTGIKPPLDSRVYGYFTKQKGSKFIESSKF